MHGNRLEADIARAWKLYNDEGWTLGDIVKSGGPNGIPLGIGRTTLWRRFRELKRTCRPPGTRSAREVTP